MIFENQHTNRADTLVVKPGYVCTPMTDNVKGRSVVLPEAVVQGMFRELAANT